jgi:hypothetical protein
MTGVTMAINNWLTKEALDAIFDKLEKQPIRIIGLDEKENRELVIWASQPKQKQESS